MKILKRVIFVINQLTIFSNGKTTPSTENLSESKTAKRKWA